jgi:hypothetical protein
MTSYAHTKQIVGDAAANLAARVGLPPTTGKLVFVDSGATGAGTTSVALSDPTLGAAPKGSIYSTLASAMDNVTATNGDVIVVMPGHAETTTAVAIDVAGITIVGLGNGRARPTFTATTAATNLFDVSVANVHIENIRLVGAASGVTALMDITADDFSATKCSFEQAATPLVGITVTSANRGTFKDCVFMGTAAGPNAAIDFEDVATAVTDWTITGCKFNFSGSSGLDEAAIRAVNPVTGFEISNCVFIGMDVTALDFNSSSGAAAVDGIVFGNRMAATTALTSVEDIIDPGGFGYIDNLAVDAPDVRGANVPLASAT